ncbi:uncharacterized protein LOC134529803 [Bacillus rossius redtenbacheri]|uniref:uncharacterized protein LOC134529803 n=1 Tax=Bacillus rossius redtenbacheri TaxID=93214 RepID=UPI002FDEE969
MFPRGVRANPEQVAYLLDYMMLHPAFASGRCLGPAGRAKLKAMWKDLCEALNKLGSPKDTTLWQRTWSDMKTKARRKAMAIKSASLHQKPGNPKMVGTLTSNEAKVVAIVGFTSCLGISAHNEKPLSQEEQLELMAEENSEGDLEPMEDVDPIEFKVFPDGELQPVTEESKPLSFQFAPSPQQHHTSEPLDSSEQSQSSSKPPHSLHSIPELQQPPSPLSLQQTPTGNLSRKRKLRNSSISEGINLNAGPYVSRLLNVTNKFVKMHSALTNTLKDQTDILAAGSNRIAAALEGILSAQLAYTVAVNANTAAVKELLGQNTRHSEEVTATLYGLESAVLNNTQ